MTKDKHIEEDLEDGAPVAALPRAGGEAEPGAAWPGAAHVAHGHMEGVAFADGSMVRTTGSEESSGDRGLGGVLERYMREFGKGNEAEAIEEMQFWQEVFQPENGRKPAAPASTLTPVEGISPMVVPIKAKLIDIFGILLGFAPDDEKWFYRLRLLLWSLDDRLVDDALGHQSPADWWRFIGDSKWMAYKIVKEFQEKLSLPKRKSQRKPEACAKMARKTKAAWAKGKAKKS